MLIGNDKLKNAASSLTTAAAPLADAGMSGQRAAASKFEDGSNSVRDRTSRMQDEASRGFGETVRWLSPVLKTGGSAISATALRRI